MAFIGIFIVYAFFLMIVMAIVFLITGFILKVIGKRKHYPRMRIIGSILFVIGVVLAIPIILMIVNMIVNKY